MDSPAKVQSQLLCMSQPDDMRSVGNLDVPSLGQKRRQLLSRPIWADVRASVDERRRDVKVRDLTEQRGINTSFVGELVNQTVLPIYSTSMILRSVRHRGLRMTPPHPGDFVRTEIVEELGLSADEAARILEVDPSAISNVLSGRTPLSPELALRVEKAFGVGMDMLLRMQAWYDASQMRAREHEIRVERYAPLSS